MTVDIFTADEFENLDQPALIAHISPQGIEPLALQNLVLLDDVLTERGQAEIDDGVMER